MRSPSALFDDPRLRRALHLLNGGGEETRIVGGAVRNALIGLPPGDIDLATTMLPEVATGRAKGAKIRVIPTGIAHGTVTLIVGGLPLEVTTLREDIATDGRHAVVRFGRDFARDAARRDFTMNALSLGLDGTLHDTTGGVADLGAGHVRFIGDPATRIREDYLRILRFFRFHATYGRGALDPEGYGAVIANRDGLERLSRERIRAEVLKILAAPGAVAAAEAMADAGVLPLVLRGTADVGRLRRLPDPDADALLRLGALALRAQDDVERLRDALRLSNVERDRLRATLDALADVGDEVPGPDRVRRLLFEHGPAAVRDALALAQAADAHDQDWGAAQRLADETTVPVFPYGGGDVTARGLKGRAVGLALADLRRAFVQADFPEDAAARAALIDAVVPRRDQPTS